MVVAACRAPERQNVQQVKAPQHCHGYGGEQTLLQILIRPLLRCTTLLWKPGRCSPGVRRSVLLCFGVTASNLVLSQSCVSGTRQPSACWGVFTDASSYFFSCWTLGKVSHSCFHGVVDTHQQILSASVVSKMVSMA